MTDRLRLDPDPLVPTDVDRAYSMGFVDGWDSTKPRLPLLAPVLAGLVGLILGALITAAAIHAAPRPAQTTERFDVSPLSSAGPAGAPLGPVARSSSANGARVTPSPDGGAPIPSPAARAGTSSALATGIASWYSDRSQPADGLYAAVPGWHFGDARYELTVCLRHSSRCVVVTVRDFCGCPGGRVIDLSPAAFGRLAPLSRGVLFVTVVAVPAGPLPTPPATDVGP